MENEEELKTEERKGFGWATFFTQPSSNAKPEKLSVDEFLNNATEVKPLELEPTKYEGRKARIDDLTAGEDAPFPESTQPAYWIKLHSTVLDILQPGDQKVRASVKCYVKKDSQGNWFWTPQSRLGLLMKKLKVGSPRDLIGKEVVVRADIGKTTGRVFLTF